ncbi:MAG: ATP-binding protein [Lacunisphaera sp.]
MVLAGIGIISVVIAAGLYRYLRRRISEPLTELSASARKITLEKDYSIRAKKSGDDEFGDLTDALNTMLEQIHSNNLALHEQEEKFRTLADNMVQLAWMADSAGNYLWYNKRWHDYTGLDLVSSKTDGWETVHPDHRERLEAELQESFATGRVWNDTFPLRGADGTYRWFLSNALPIRSQDNKILRWFGTNTDVTELRDIQQELSKARDEALAASSAKDDFLARLSHELRTPLSPVLLIVSDANENEELPPRVRHDYGTIKKNVELEARLIDDLLDLTAIVRGKLVLHRQIASLNDIVQDAVAKVMADAVHKNVTIKAEIAPGNPLVECDAVRVQQAIWNVLKNAVKFSPIGGKVVVNARRSVSLDSVSVTTTDEGIGMSSNELTRVFEAFAQGDHAGGGGSHRFGGLGLGLAISRRVIELHGGKIVASSPGVNQGSTFHIELPVGNVPSDHRILTKRSLERADSFEVGPTHAVLLVEDHEPTRLILERLLSRRRFMVTAAGSLAEARAAFALRPFALLITDIGLPDGSGYELIREFRIHSKIVGIALTGYGMESDVNSAREAGFLIHLTKPIDANSLDRALETALKNLPSD